MYLIYSLHLNRISLDYCTDRITGLGGVRLLDKYDSTKYYECVLIQEI